MEKILQKYREWRGEEDDSWNYDMIYEFFSAVLSRGEMVEIIEFLQESAQKEKETPPSESTPSTV